MHHAHFHTNRLLLLCQSVNVNINTLLHSEPHIRLIIAYSKNYIENFLCNLFSKLSAYNKLRIPMYQQIKLTYPLIIKRFGRERVSNLIIDLIMIDMKRMISSREQLLPKFLITRSSL